MNSPFTEMPPEPAPAHRYSLFGLSFATDRPIPGLVEDEGSDFATVTVAFAPVPHAIHDPSYRDDTVQASATEYLFAYPGYLRLYVDGTTKITVEPLVECDPSRMWTFLLGICASIIGFRRGFIPLHAAAVQGHGGCVALAGNSGAGKSTLAASLCDRGFTLHTEDLCLVQPASEAHPRVGSGIRELRLWDDAAEALDWTHRVCCATEPGMPKSVYRLTPAPPALLPLKRVYALEFHDEDGPEGIHRVHGVDALQTLIASLRLRPGLLSVGAREQTFASLASISNATEVYRFVRPHDRHQLQAWSERLANHIAA
jgi:hypothetical protein